MTESSLQFGAPLEGATQASDEQFIASVRWRNSQPGMGAELVSDADLKAVGLCWKHHCLERGLTDELRIGFASLVPGTNELVAIAESLRPATAADSRKRRSRKRRAPQKKRASGPAEALSKWLETNAGLLETGFDSLLAACEILAFHADRLPGATVGRLWRATLSGAIAQAATFEEAAGVDDWSALEPDADFATRTMGGGLLPWVCGLLFDEVKGAPRLARLGRRTLNRQLRDLSDGPGRPHSLAVQELPLFLANWTDALLAAEIFERSLWKESCEGRFERFVQKAASLLSFDAGARDGVNLSLLDLFGRARELSSLPSSSSASKLMQSLGRSAGSSGKKKQTPATTAVRTRKIDKKNIPSWQSDEGDAACLRTTWAADAGILTLAHHASSVQIRLVTDGVPMLSGPLGLSLSEDGEELELDYEDGWECVCWFSDKEIDYCEIQLEFEGGPKICRHVMLHRYDQYAVISDVVTETEAKRLDWSMRLPLHEAVSAKESPGRRELRLKSPGTTARVFPLVLPQDAGLGTAGELHFDDAGLAIHYPTESGSLFAPVIIDWNPKRRTKQAEWRKLTVTEAGDVDPDGAAAYRFAIGDLQLVLFRTLRPTDRYRTVLGYFIEHETVIARFTKDGDFDELVVVE